MKKWRVQGPLVLQCPVNHPIPVSTGHVNRFNLLNAEWHSELVDIYEDCEQGVLSQDRGVTFLGEDVPKNAESVDHSHDVSVEEVIQPRGIAVPKGQHHAQVACLLQTLNWIQDLPGVPMLQHHVEALLGHNHNIGDTRQIQQAIETLVISYAFDGLAQRGRITGRCVGRRVVQKTMQRVVLGASKTQGLSRNLLILELVGISQMNEGVAD